MPRALSEALINIDRVFLGLNFVLKVHFAKNSHFRVYSPILFGFMLPYMG